MTQLLQSPNNTDDTIPNRPLAAADQTSIGNQAPIANNQQDINNPADGDNDVQILVSPTIPNTNQTTRGSKQGGRGATANKNEETQATQRPEPNHSQSK
jgi:hypothetical protein